MYLNEVIIISFISLASLLFNLVFKYYYIFKRGYRISNLIVVKLVIRALSIILLAVVLGLGFDKYILQIEHENNIVNYILPISSRGRYNLDKAMISKINELSENQKEPKAGLLIHDVESDKYFLAIPSTSVITFLSLIRSENLNFDYKILQELNKNVVTGIKSGRIVLFTQNKDQVDNRIKSGKNHYLNFLNNWGDTPFIHVYLLILTLIFVSFDLFIKLRIIKK